MNRPPFKFIVLLMLCLGSLSPLHAQINHWRDSWKTNSRITSTPPNFYERMHLGYTYTTVFAQQQQTQYTYKPDGSVTQKELTRTVRTFGGNGFSIGSFFTLTRFRSDVIALAFSMDYNLNKLSWEELDSGFTYRPKLKDFKTTDYTVQMGMPMSLDIKLGSDAMPSNNYKWSASFGAGLYPMMAYTNKQKKKQVKEPLYVGAAAVPFIKVEGGRRIGILMKLRVLMLFGGPEYLDRPSSVDGRTISYNNAYSLTGKFSTNISLLLYPFSHNWPEYGWWQ